MYDFFFTEAPGNVYEASRPSQSRHGSILKIAPKKLILSAISLIESMNVDLPKENYRLHPKPILT